MRFSGVQRIMSGNIQPHILTKRIVLNRGARDLASSSTADRAAFLHRFVWSRQNNDEQEQWGVCESLQSGLLAGDVFDERCAEAMVSTSLFRITGHQHLFSSKQEIMVCNMTSPDFHGFLCNSCLLLLLPKYRAKCAKADCGFQGFSVDGASTSPSKIWHDALQNKKLVPCLWQHWHNPGKLTLVFEATFIQQSNHKWLAWIWDTPFNI